MYNRLILITFGFLTTLNVNAAFAQQNVDLERATCSTWLVTNPEGHAVTASWLQGYFSAASQDMQLSFTGSADTLEKISNACRANPALTIAVAFRTAMGIAHFQCDAAASDTCQFAIFSGGATTASRRFALAGNQKGLVNGLKINADFYCVCVNRPAPNAYGQCVPAAQGGCKRATISGTSNN